MTHHVPSARPAGQRLTKLLRGSLAVAFTIVLAVFPSACGRDALPTSAGTGGPLHGSATNVDTFTNAGTQEQMVALEIVSRTRYLKAEHFEPVKQLSQPDQGLFVLHQLTPDAPVLSAHMIVMGPSVGPPREIDRVTYLGDTVRIETHPAPWHLVSGAGPLRVRIPMARAAGRTGPVSWGEWELVEPSDGLYLKSDAGGAQIQSPSPLDVLGLGFDGFELCTGNTGSFCVGLKPKILEGSCDIRGKIDLEIVWRDPDEFCHFTGPWPWDWDCEFNPVTSMRFVDSLSVNAKLLMELEGSAHAGVEVPLGTIGRAITIFGLEGRVGLTINLFGDAGIEEVRAQTGFTLNTGIDVDVGWSEARNGFYNDSQDPTFNFQPIFVPLSAGVGFVKLGIEPELGLSLQVVEDLAAVEASVGLPAYLKFAADLAGGPTDCPNWHCKNTANLDLDFELKLALEAMPDPSTSWTLPISETVISEHWGTGDLMVSTHTTGKDVDPDGYRIMVRRADPTAEPAWMEEYDLQMRAWDEHLWTGGSCRYLNPSLFDPSGILDCDLVATQHRVQIDGVMWNCALQGEADRLRCLEAEEQVTETFDVDCVSAYAFLMDEVNAALVDGAIRNEGIANSILAKLGNAEMKRDQGDYPAAMGLLRALDHFLAISAGHQVDATFAQHLSARVQDVMRLFVWPQEDRRPRQAGL